MWTLLCCFEPCIVISPFHRPWRPLGRVEVYLYSVFDLGTRRGWEVSVTPRPHLTPWKDPVPIVQEAGWASGPVWMGAENLAPTGIRSEDRPARRQSLYRLALWCTYVISTKQMQTFSINDLIQLHCLRRVSNNQLFILGKTSMLGCVCIKHVLTSTILLIQMHENVP